PNGFHFTLLDWQMDYVAVKIKQRVEARGEKFYLYISYGDWKDTSFEHWTNPAEYGEFMLAIFDHLQARYGFVPDGISIINEPDLSNDWRGSQIGNAIVSAGARLGAAGFHPDFIA